MKTTTRQASTVDLAPRIAAKQQREQKRIDDELLEVARCVPWEVLKPLLKAVADDTPAPLFKLPVQWRKKALEAWRECMEPQPSAEVLLFSPASCSQLTPAPRSG
jgi:hypothetical protein